MSFYKCDVCQVGTNLARQCGLAKCSHIESRCVDHGGDVEAIRAIQAHMKTHETVFLGYASLTSPTILNHEYLSDGDTPYASKYAPGKCVICGESRKDHAK